MKVLVTGGAGFIGSAVCRHLVRDLGFDVVNVDRLTYASSLDGVAGLEATGHYSFHQLDILAREQILALMAAENIDAVMHLAAESHVDRSIDGPAPFIHTNIVGTFELLEAARIFHGSLRGQRADAFRFLHVSTDEVFGALPLDDTLFTATSPYAPSSPYSASKAASDHLVRAWGQTYGLPIVVSNCSNNYGPFQFPEKLVPLMILNALEDKPLPVYGTGANIRDWLYVEDHARALGLIVSRGRPGETYMIGAHAERSNLAVVEAIADRLDLRVPGSGRRRDLIRFVSDRPGHDLRYAIDAEKIRHELGWTPRETFESGLEKTIEWYCNHAQWWEKIRKARYDGARLGKG